MSDPQEESLKVIVQKAVADAFKEEKDVNTMRRDISSAIISQLMDRGLTEADAATRLKVKELEKELVLAQQAKNRLAKAHQMLAVRLGIWGKDDSTLGDESWYIWVDRQPAWDGYLPYTKHISTPQTEEEFEGHVYSTRDTKLAFSFIDEEAARDCILIFVHAHLRPYCTPTRKRE